MVKNDFPNADSVLRKLKEYVAFFKQKISSASEEEKEDYEYYIELASNYTNAVAKYLDSVCNSELRIAKVKETANSREEIQAAIEREDNIRTRNHSEIIKNMILIDRIAARNGLAKVFNVAGKFEQDFSQLTPNTIEEKRKMSTEARVKRREMGNFGLYIGASVTAGMSRQYMITDEEARNFADCEGNKQKTDMDTYERVRLTSRNAKKNLDDIAEIS